MFTDANANNNVAVKDPTIMYDDINQQDSKETQMIDLSKIDLDLDDVEVASSQIGKNSILLEPLSASKLQLLQDTTMIESALDLDSLEESTSSLGASSHAGLIKSKHTL